MTQENEQERETGDGNTSKGGDSDKSEGVGGEERKEGAEEGRGGDPDKSKRI